MSDKVHRQHEFEFGMFRSLLTLVSGNSDFLLQLGEEAKVQINVFQKFMDTLQMHGNST